MDIFLPIGWFADTLTFRLLSIPHDSAVGNSVNFFIYDSLKIFLMLLVINFLMAVVRQYLPVHTIRTILTKRNWYGFDYFLAAVFGVVTPFCSCSSIPLFIGFVGAGIPLGVTFAFLITSPLVNEASLALFPSAFGVQTTLIYNAMGIVVGMLGGMIIQQLHMERFIEPSLLRFTAGSGAAVHRQHVPLRTSVIRWWTEGWQITRSLLPYVFAGIGIGALIHGFVPAGFFASYLSANRWWSVPAATLLGVPLYANSVSVIPVMEALISKGVPLGTALAFMTATVTLSIPEALILGKAMKLPLLTVFFLVTIIGIMGMGYLFNFLTP